MVRPKFNFRVVLFGEKDVGRKTLFKKSSIYRYDESNFDILGAGFTLKELTIEGNELQLVISNINYDEEFRFLLLGFIKNSHASFLMFDITSVSSFNFLSGIPELIRNYTGDIPIWLVGNKLDLEEAREVSGEEARIFARDNDLMGYVEISAKSGQGCEELFELMGSFLYNSYKDLVGKEEEEKFIRKKKKKQKKKTQKE